jgi:exopolysaccharide biosynthesis polyprenyl glycosylphosphotransferase
VLKRHHQALRALLLVLDAAGTSLALVLAYAIRFRSGWLPVPKGVPPAEDYLLAWPLAVGISVLAYRYHGLYEPKRFDRLAREVLTLLKATGTALLVTVAVTFFARLQAESRGVIVLFAALNPLLLTALRGAVRFALRALRRRGYNQRDALIIGTGRVAQTVAERLRENPWMGVRVAGFVEAGDARRANVRGFPVIGTTADLSTILRARTVDQVFVALPFRRYRVLRDVLDRLAREAVTVRLVPDLPGLAGMNASIDDLDGLPVLGLYESPVYGLYHLAKRMLDVVGAGVGLALFAPLMGAIALAIRLTSPGPVLFRQERMGLDGRPFEMLKFRTMRADVAPAAVPAPALALAATAGGAAATPASSGRAQAVSQWTTRDDPRVTRLGRFLRKTSLDELPQLVNVLRGEMSIVGPRPERPVLVEKFRRHLPRYMRRHTVKAGMTGWAQVNGWRGNTSLRKRLQYDLYYIENWSLAFDLKIMALTLVRGFVHPNAY